MKILDEVKRHRMEVKTDAYSISWGELINWFRDKELRVDPEYQRLFRWSLTQQTRLIESILLDIPMPPIFLAQNEDSKHEVIDGLQRVSTVIKFFAPLVFGEKVKEKESGENVNTLEVPTTLEEGALIPALSGYTSETLPEPLLISIKKARVQLVILTKESSKKARYEVFKRVNTYGAQLTAQEVRNCTARLLGPEFPTLLAKLASEPPIVSAMGFDEERENRRGVEEMVLRLLALNHSKEEVKHDVENFLDSFMENGAEGKFQITDDIYKQILDSFKLISMVYPNGDAFRFQKKGKPYGQFSTNVFDSVASGVFKNIKKLDESRFKKLQSELVASDELKKLTGAGSNTRKKIQGRVHLGISWFK